MWAEDYSSRKEVRASPPWVFYVNMGREGSLPGYEQIETLDSLLVHWRFRVRV